MGKIWGLYAYFWPVMHGTSGNLLNYYLSIFDLGYIANLSTLIFWAGFRRKLGVAPHAPFRVWYLENQRKSCPTLCTFRVDCYFDLLSLFKLRIPPQLQLCSVYSIILVSYFHSNTSNSLLLFPSIVMW